MTNPLTADREAFAAALATLEDWKVEPNQPEILNPGLILFYPAIYEPGKRFGTLQATYQIVAVLPAVDAASATLAGEQAIVDILAAAAETADLKTVRELANILDGNGAIYPAQQIEFTSLIDLERI